MATSMRDVAQLAGVSPRTVSNVVNEYEYVRDSTRERVLRAIEELNYKPNISARRLREGRTRILGFAVPELSQPYFAELSELVESAAHARGYTVIATQTAGRKDNELRMLREFTSHLVDGLIFSPFTLTDEEFHAATPSVPTVLIGEQISSPRHTGIAIDNVQATTDITRHLLEQRRRRIAVLGAYHSDLYRSARLRLQGYRDALESSGIAFDPDLVLYTDRFGRRAGYDGVTGALAHGLRFDALVCFTDMLAFGAVRAFADAGVRVPEDVAIASIDDVQEAEFSVPSLTTVAPDKKAIADTAVEQVLSLVDEPEAPPRSVEIAYRLVTRESSAVGE
ncbi:LacI family transcriptional regulator [Microbacterium sp. zg.Y1090]|uniref:LacI family DNA-binding transcriptional regulator n=1 Tax=Microbacterium TaxID=33882 RepID=UPI00214CAF57|nr:MULTISPECIES: LacI family DNA-binding transcriptional regulator [unclassified Microbacterium]MCR2813671.1 LacI family transcriptional regulator [Microbacterium sp. zg.Y1084]MCR2817996.1 LacI family transcriptional regulator [Microbacterium sp. zg.Y1090]MDL5488086.1 LacI family DNA-binding transcriptional regulator [Microbacterium sp. zg-Y1211]WIM27842.1 LacI family DNA-binding transcriptional regulator [Microbacterium sp. zg-Y1090]